ncbi:FRG domain-containing protein [Pantoea sp. GM01]|uniref:FRG domain-containing protein n=1 Tax=Pantoea sp. GM01 TaxID=1144320 RepID=UPI000270E1D2|nr:FRG domain-containing protein [Pantoea sp. GM01]EJL88024.1 FRG domain protein [Pantoea sp. GM01]
MIIKNNNNRLIEIMRNENIPEEMINDVIDSGYTIVHSLDPFTGTNYEVVGDGMYGNKQFSGHLDIQEFIHYIRGNNTFEKLTQFNEYTVKNYNEIESILSESKRRHYIDKGRLSFRGQTSQYYFQRKIPSPVRANDDGKELSIFPGLYRQSNHNYSFNIKPEEERSFVKFLNELEPNNPRIYLDSNYSYDLMRTEQHYATQTSGLDISFDIETAIFFATHKLNYKSDGKAYHTKVSKGEHQGVIYGFCFRDPSVPKTEFLIKDFDLFKTYNPERILRQDCGLPLIMDNERNIAITDLDFIIRLDADFDYNGKKQPAYMFPNTKEDLFYGKLLELKDKYPNKLPNILEYVGSRV